MKSKTASGSLAFLMAAGFLFTGCELRLKIDGLTPDDSNKGEEPISPPVMREDFKLSAVIFSQDDLSFEVKPLRSGVGFSIKASQRVPPICTADEPISYCSEPKVDVRRLDVGVQDGRYSILKAAFFSSSHELRGTDEQLLFRTTYGSSSQMPCQVGVNCPGNSRRARASASYRSRDGREMMRELSNLEVCDRSTGRCESFEQFEEEVRMEFRWMHSVVRMKRSFFIQEDYRCQLVEDVSKKLGSTLKELQSAGLPGSSIAYRSETGAVARQQQCLACGCGGLSGSFWIEASAAEAEMAEALGFEPVWTPPEGDNFKVLMERQDGSIQCSRSNPSVAERFAKARQDLQRVRVSEDTLEWRAHGNLNVIAMCGAPSGSVIRLRVLEQDRRAVESLGFREVSEPMIMYRSY